MARRALRCVVSFTLLLVASSRGARAQDVARPVCRDPHPAPACSSYLVFEYNGALRAAGNKIDVDFSRTKAHPSWFGVTAGRMWNRSASTSIGGALEVGPTEDGTRIALRAKRRSWLANNLVLDVSGGPLMTQLQTNGTGGVVYTYGATGDIGVGRARVGLLTLGADVAQQRGQFAFATHLGARLESRGSVVATAATAVAGLVALGFFVTHRGALDGY